jgi:hypothetical protein
MDPDDLTRGGVVRVQPVPMRLREGPVGQWPYSGLWIWGRPIGCPLIALLALRHVHRTRAAEGRTPMRDPALLATSLRLAWREPA